MKTFITLAFVFCYLVPFSQSKEELIETYPSDSVMQYEGEGVLSKGNCLIIKFTGDAVLFFNELAAFHAQDEDQLERTQTTLAIYDTSKPYWVYGRYSVYAQFEDKGDFRLIQIHFKAYSNPENYKILSAKESYQKIVNRLLGKI